MHLLVGRYLEAGPAGLRWRAAQLIGTCSQNVAAIQEQVLGLGALRKLLRLLDRDTCDLVRVKALFAISCECLRQLGRGRGSHTGHMFPSPVKTVLGVGERVESPSTPHRAESQMLRTRERHLAQVLPAHQGLWPLCC